MCYILPLVIPTNALGASWRSLFVQLVPSLECSGIHCRSQQNHNSSALLSATTNIAAVYLRKYDQLPVHACLMH
jgi:hypothetical protein